MKRTPGGTVSPARSSANREMMAGTALIQVIRRSCHELPETRPMEAVVEYETGAGDKGGEERHHLGIDVEQRQRVEAAVVRREVVVLRPHSERCTGVAPGARRTTLGGPVVPEEERTTPPEADEGRRRRPGATGSAAFSGRARPSPSDARRRPVGQPGRPRAPVLVTTRFQAARAVVGRRRIERGHPQARRHGAENGCGTGQGVGDRHGDRRAGREAAVRRRPAAIARESPKRSTRHSGDPRRRPDPRARPPAVRRAPPRSTAANGRCRRSPARRRERAADRALVVGSGRRHFSTSSGGRCSA